MDGMEIAHKPSCEHPTFTSVSISPFMTPTSRSQRAIRAYSIVYSCAVWRARRRAWHDLWPGVPFISTRLCCLESIWGPGPTEFPSHTGSSAAKNQVTFSVRLSAFTTSKWDGRHLRRHSDDSIVQRKWYARAVTKDPPGAMLSNCYVTQSDSADEMHMFDLAEQNKTTHACQWHGATLNVASESSGRRFSGQNDSLSRAVKSKACVRRWSHWLNWSGCQSTY